MSSPSPEEVEFIQRVRHEAVRYGGPVVGFCCILGGLLVFMNAGGRSHIVGHGVITIAAGAVAVVLGLVLADRERFSRYSMRQMLALVALVYLPWYLGYITTPHNDIRPLLLLMVGFGFGSLSLQWSAFTLIAMAAPILFAIRANWTPGSMEDCFYILAVAYPFSILVCFVVIRQVRKIFSLKSQIKSRETALNQALEELSAEQLGREVAEKRKRESDAELQQQRDRFLHVGRVNVMGEMAAGIAHEINQPLSAIALHAGILRHENSKPSDKVTAANEIVALTNRCGKIIRRLQGFVRYQSSESRIVDVNQLITESIALVSSDIKKHRIDLEFAPSPHAEARADEIQVQQVMVNLLRNACESMSDSESTREARITCEPNGKMVHIRISDRGHGMDTNRLPHAFDAFSTTKPDGLGMGWRSAAPSWNAMVEPSKRQPTRRLG